MFPIESAPLRKRILAEIVPAYLADHVKARELQADGTYTRVRPAGGDKPFRCQQALLEDAAEGEMASQGKEKRKSRKSM